MFSSSDQLSKNFLTSIPTKVTAWLRNLGELKRQKGFFGDLNWRIRNNEGVSFLEHGDVRIEWRGKIGDIYSVSCNESWTEDITSNMDRFVALEKSIYDELTKLEEIVNERNLQAFQTT